MANANDLPWETITTLTDGQGRSWNLGYIGEASPEGSGSRPIAIKNSDGSVAFEVQQSREDGNPIEWWHKDLNVEGQTIYPEQSTIRIKNELTGERQANVPYPSDYPELGIFYEAFTIGEIARAAAAAGEVPTRTQWEFTQETEIAGQKLSFGQLVTRELTSQVVVDVAGIGVQIPESGKSYELQVEHLKSRDIVRFLEVGSRRRVDAEEVGVSEDAIAGIKEKALEVDAATQKRGSWQDRMASGADAAQGAQR